MRGLFGKKLPGMMGGYGGGTFDAPGQTNEIDYTPQARAVMDGQAPMPEKRGGGLKDVLLGALGGAADGAAQFFGGQPLIAQQRQFQQVQAMRQAEMERQRSMDLADYRTKLGIQAEFATPEKDAFDRALANAGIDPKSPQGVDLYRQRAMTMAQGQPQEPRMVTLPDGRAIFGTMDEIQRIISGGQAAPANPQVLGQSLPQGWTVEGGAGGNASSNFR